MCRHAATDNGEITHKRQTCAEMKAGRRQPSTSHLPQTHICFHLSSIVNSAVGSTSTQIPICVPAFQSLCVVITFLLLDPISDTHDLREGRFLLAKNFRDFGSWSTGSKGEAAQQKGLVGQEAVRQECRRQVTF